MKWAIKNKTRIEATPKVKAKCPICNEEVIAKCGSIKIWHWAHKNKEDCDSWYEPESQWHLDWKNEFPKEQQEFSIGRHRADIRTKDRWIIELQNSSISSEEIIERENYYKRMIWLLNGYKICNGLRLRNKKGLITFRWKHPPKNLWSVRKKIYIDLNFIPLDGMFKDEISNFTSTQKKFWKGIIGKIFLIKKIYHKIPCGGYGELISKEDFLKKFKGEGDDTKTIN